MNTTALENSVVSPTYETVPDSLSNIDQITNALLQRPELVQLIAGIVDYTMTQPSAASFDIDRLDKFAAALSSSEYLAQNMHVATKHKSHYSLLAYALSRVTVPGLIMEFGVHRGASINLIAQAYSGTVYGFDSFEGLPEYWKEDHPKGKFALDTMPTVGSNVELIKGWFERTLPSFLDYHPEPASFIHVDCDLYSSTQTVLMALRNRMVVGTIILFDEYYNYPSWQMHEYKAFQEFVRSMAIQYEYIGACTNGYSVAIRITGTGICGRA